MFDRQFIISLQRTKAKLSVTQDHLSRQGIVAEPFDGMDGSITGLETRWQYEVDNPRTGYRIGPRTVNLYLSHYMLWKCCQYTSGDSFLVLEDDVRFDDDWRDHIGVALANLPSNWDLLYVGSCCCQGREHQQVSGRLHKTSFALCTHAYAVRRKALPILLERCARVWSGVDITMVFNAIPFLETFAILPRIAHQFQTNIAP
jgi:GR25 family glycosyltransferase involved in LPS biosynthesis